MTYFIVRNAFRVDGDKFVLAGSGDVIAEGVEEYDICGGYAGETIIGPQGEFLDIKYDHAEVMIKDFPKRAKEEQ